MAAVTLAASTVWVAACGRDEPLTFAPAPAASATGPIVVHEPPKLTSIETGKLDAHGRELRVACVTCHGVRDAGAPFPEQASDLREFHNGLVVDHGKLACPSCHLPSGGGEPRLRLADGTVLPTRDTMTLCAQCHGKKHSDYQRGVHGGMNGYWDLSRGGRLRNHCVDCHDPHVPKYQPSRPVLPPRDRTIGEASHG
ncbi:MAG: hypothetical protein IPQ09_13080 [Myxococcales bacterium]|nr:hypothetical protein [Myxococcales bacterium]HQY61839.1 cytochrome c3 family protein [Polyangiaceae bacterium]